VKSSLVKTPEPMFFTILAAFGLLHAPLQPRAVAMRKTAHAAVMSSPTNRFGGTPLRPGDDDMDDEVAPLRPVELQGGWEVRTDRSGMEETWFELFEDGSLETSRSAFGRGRMWRAKPRAGGWNLIVTVEDKLKRPLTFDGRVREDEYVRHLSARVAARLLLHGADPEDDTLKAYYKWLLTEVESGDRTRMLPALSCLAQVFRRTPFRLAFCRLPNAVDLLRVQVGVDAPIQQLYQAILCLWILSFSGEAVELMGESAFAAVASVADVLASAKKEKVVRVCVAFLRNMAEVENKEKSLEATTLMVSHRLLTVVQGLATQGTFSYVQGSGDWRDPGKGRGNGVPCNSSDWLAPSQPPFATARSTGTKSSRRMPRRCLSTCASHLST
jgi:hypothetical protein